MPFTEAQTWIVKMTMWFATAHPEQYPWLRQSAMAVESRLNLLTQKFTSIATLFPWVSDAQRHWERQEEPQKTKLFIDWDSLTYVSFFVALPRLDFHFTAALYQKRYWSLLKPSITRSFPWMTLKKQSTQWQQQAGVGLGLGEFHRALLCYSTDSLLNLMRAHCEPKFIISHLIHQNGSSVWTTPLRQRQN